MTSVPNRDLKSILRVFTTGSLVVLALSLVTTGVLCSMTLLEKDKERAEIFNRQLVDSFDLQYRMMTEEMWVKNYQAVAMSIASIAKEFDNSSYRLFVSGPDMKCVYQSGSGNDGSSDCSLPQKASEIIERLKTHSDLSHYLKFDPEIDRYVYSAPLKIGSDLLGYLYVTIDDPYDFYRGRGHLLYIRVFLPGTVFIILVVGIWLFASRKYILRPYLSSMVEIEKSQALGKLAAQVAHDIQSPLAALTGVLQNTSSLPLQQNQLIKSVAYRIQSLADDLLRRYKDPDSNPEIQFTLVSAVINSIIAEKMVILGKESQIQIQTDVDRNAMIAGIPLSGMVFSRVLSNILKNSIQALKDIPQGMIQLSVKADEDFVSVTVTDNGRGMDPEVLNRVRTQGGSFGKSDGFGIGLRYSKEMIENAGGKLQIDSTLGVGTVVQLRIPQVQLPQWCATSLGLRRGDKVVILDDDLSVHLLWQERLSDIDVIFLKDPSDFDLKRYPADQYRYIFDYEISGSSITGLDLVRSFGIASRTILVTSYFNDSRVQSQVIELGTKILPKFLISSVPIYAKDPIEIKHDVEMPDLILIDDDPMTHKVWKIQGQYQNKKVLTVFREDDLNWGSVPDDMPLYVDRNLGDGVSGLEVVKRLHQLGFKKIFLTTGDRNFDKNEVSFLAGVLDKSFPKLGNG